MRAMSRKKKSMMKSLKRIWTVHFRMKKEKKNMMKKTTISC
jgi:hypothetical protein